MKITLTTTKTVQTMGDRKNVEVVHEIRNDVNDNVYTRTDRHTDGYGSCYGTCEAASMKNDVETSVVEQEVRTYADLQQFADAHIATDMDISRIESELEIDLPVE